jgi:transketolase
MRAIPTISIVLPCDNAQTDAATRFLCSHVGPVYMRLGRSPVPDVYDSSSEAFEFGKAKRLREGTDCTIIACGEMVSHVLAAADALRVRGIEVRVLDMATIKPLDIDAILEAAEETGVIVTVEENSIYGGLGAAVAEVVVQHRPIPMKILGFPDEFVPAGSSNELFEYYGFGESELTKTIQDFIGQVRSPQAKGGGQRVGLRGRSLSG